MARLEPVVLVFTGLALAWGAGSAFAGDAADWDPLVATGSTAAVVCAFGWTRRGRDVGEVFFPAFLVAYAAYAGLAIERMSQPSLTAIQWQMGTLVDQLPGVVLGGLPFALVMTVFVALPVSLLPHRNAAVSAPRSRFWEFVREQNALRAGGVQAERER